MEFEVWPGPMEGIGKGGFITAVNNLKLIDRWMTPFVRLSQEVPRQGKLAAFYAGFKASGVPVCVQLMGIDPGLLAQAGAVFVGFGAESININFGCPSSRVISGGAGGGALKTPEKLADFCCKVRAGLPAEIPLSVKIRSGWENCNEMEKFLPEIAASGAVDKIFFHCRTVKELYKPIEEKERYRRFRHAVELAVAMECRCYTGSGATRMRQLRITARDVWCVVTIIVLIGGIVALNIVLPSVL